MVYSTLDCRVIGLCLLSVILKKTTFREPDLLPSSGRWLNAPALLGSLRSSVINGPNSVGVSSPHLRKETCTKHERFHDDNIYYANI